MDSFTPSCINVIAIVSNPTEENKTFLHELFKELYADEKVSTNRCKVFIIVIDNEEKCTTSLIQSSNSSAEISSKPTWMT